MTKERQADKRQNQNYLELNARVVRLLAQFQTLDLTSFVHVFMRKKFSSHLVCNAYHIPLICHKGIKGDSKLICS